MRTQHERFCGTRHLRVALEISDRGLAVTSIWTVAQPLVQQAELYKPLLIVAEIAGSIVYIDAVDDPRQMRGTYRQGFGHSYGRAESGILSVAIPFDTANDLLSARVRVADVSEAIRTIHDPVVLATRAEAKKIGVITAKELTSHPDWVRVTTEVGLPKPVGRFEIYRDKAGEFRWRLRRPDGAIVADSGEGYADRAKCEEDVRWVRANAGKAGVAGLDVTPEDPVKY